MWKRFKKDTKYVKWFDCPIKNGLWISIFLMEYFWNLCALPSLLISEPGPCSQITCVPSFQPDQKLFTRNPEKIRPKELEGQCSNKQDGFTNDFFQTLKRSSFWEQCYK